MENINEIIGQNLLKLRKQKKLTQLELADKFNYSDKSISKWEKGESLPSIEVLHELSTNATPCYSVVNWRYTDMRKIKKLAALLVAISVFCTLFISQVEAASIKSIYVVT